LKQAVEVAERACYVQLAAAASVFAGCILLAGCFSIPGHPDDPQDPDCLAHASFPVE
jgi:hypothetical protein